MSYTDRGDGVPGRASLEPSFANPSTEERVYSLLVGSSEAWSAPAVADALECSPDTARKYLEWFAELGILSGSDGRPRTYQRNEAYFEWRYVQQLTETHTLVELRENVSDLRERLETYRERYGEESPSAVDALREGQLSGEDVEVVWDDLSAWAGIEEELRLHERARQQLLDRSGNQSP